MTQNKMSMDYENRIILITSSRLSDETLQMALDASTNVEETKRIHTTFVGICNGFNFQRTELNNIRGCNYFGIYSSEQMKEKLVTRFDEMVCPLIFDLNVTLKTTDDQSCIQSVYSLNGGMDIEPQEDTILDLRTSFLSKTDQNIYDDEYDEKVHLLLIKLLPTNVRDFNLTLSFDDQSWTKIEAPKLLNLQRTQSEDESDDDQALLAGKQYGASNDDYYDNYSIRKAILLSRYVRLLREWVQLSNENGTHNTRTKFQHRFKQFEQYFKGEQFSVKDKTLIQELNVLQTLTSS